VAVSPRPPRRPSLPPNERPLVIAHRGASQAVAEHTLPAYRAAIAAGADGLECDVRLTRDGILVCVHDRTVNRTSDGRGVVSELDLPVLRALDFASWHDAELPASADELITDRPYVDDKRQAAAGARPSGAGVPAAADPGRSWAATEEDGDRIDWPTPYLAGVAPDRLEPDGSVLTLDTLLAAVADAGRPLTLLIETKHPTRYGGLVEKELVRLLKRYGLAAGRDAAGTALSVHVMSFAPIALRRIRLLAPSVPLVLLCDRWLAGRRDGTLPTGVRTAGPGITLLRQDPSYVGRVHAAGHRVFCWTVDSAEDLRLARRLGVDAIITNRPADVRALLGTPTADGRRGGQE
jgi:glycerophosphoryl diester phosphodiesterase